ncbi:MAG: substrate-binding domain-containing protein, partial [bacterium]
RVDNVGGAREAARHLLQLGHRRIALITGAGRGPTAREREEGFRSALLEAGVPFDPALRLEAPNFSRENGIEAGERLLALKPRPSAAFVSAGDVCATGVVLALKRAGLSVPRDLSVLGFDDQPFAELMEPALTTVRQPMERMGREAFHMLRDALKDPQERAPRRRDFETELIVRASTAKAAA